MESRLEEEKMHFISKKRCREGSVVVVGLNEDEEQADSNSSRITFFKDRPHILKFGWRFLKYWG